MACIDIVDMYNSIPIELALTCIRAFLFQNNFTVLQINEILNLISLCITCNIHIIIIY